MHQFAVYRLIFYHIDVIEKILMYTHSNTHNIETMQEHRFIYILKFFYRKRNLLKRKIRVYRERIRYPHRKKEKER